MKREIKEVVKKVVAAVACFSMFSSQSLAALPPSDGPPPPFEELNPESEVHPILDLFVYDPHINTLPPDNPEPIPVERGDEIAQITYVDAEGKLYDVQLNLTQAYAKVLRNGRVIGSGALTQAEVDELRQSSMTSAEGIALVETIIVTLLGVVVTFITVVAWSNYEDKRQCARGVISANRIMANAAVSCARKGGRYVVEMAPSMLDCGGSYAGTCEL